MSSLSIATYSPWSRMVLESQSVVVEQLEPVEPWQRVTDRLAFYIHQLCAVMTAQDVADHLALDWKTVKGIDQAFLDWCALARSLHYWQLHRFARRLERYGYGVNNKIKIIKRKAYGYRDLRYFALKIHQAFDPDKPALFGR